jgi:hypothetical protein
MAARASATTAIHTLYSTPPWDSHNPCAPVTVAMALIITPITAAAASGVNSPRAKPMPPRNSEPPPMAA